MAATLETQPIASARGIARSAQHHRVVLAPPTFTCAPAAADDRDRPEAKVAAPQPSFADVLDWHEAEIYRFALRLTGNRADADDLFQETMLKAFRAFDRLQPDSNHRAWLYRIASNTFLSGRRKVDRLDSLDLLGEQINFEVAVEEEDHAAGLDARSLLQEVSAFIENLPPKQRLALVLRKYHGLGYDDVAAALDCSEGAARTNVHQALRKLREAFADRL